MLGAACGVSTPAQPSPVATGTVAAPSGKWETMVQEAKKEGRVILYVNWRPGTRVLLTQAFKDAYGIDLEFVPFSRGAEMLARAQAEKVAGLRVVDVLGGGAGTLLSFKQAGLLGSSLEPILTAPEVTNPAAWHGGKLPFLDSEKRMIGMVATPQRRILYNTELVRPDEITGYKDLLKPQYKDKIILNDPTVTGAGVGWFADLARDLWNLEEASEFLRQLIRQQNVAIVRDNRMVVEQVARGKYSVGIAPTSDMVAEFIHIKAPLNFVVLKEGVLVAPGGGAMGLAVDPPHSNATTLFVNWLLTKEGQKLFAIQGFGSPSFRQDVPVEGLPPILLLTPGEKFWVDTEEINIFRSEMLGVSKKVIEETRR